MSCNESLREKLVEITVAILGPDPHTGGAPHPDTVDAIVEGILDVCALSNARPAKYADEPWRGHGALKHCNHARKHACIAGDSVEFNAEILWLSDLNQPEIIHAAMRCFFANWSHKRGVK